MDMEDTDAGTFRHRLRLLKPITTQDEATREFCGLWDLDPETTQFTTSASASDATAAHGCGTA